ncbi:MAG: hypothetical protein AAB510_02145 [Patescibacteria group bacterium]
MTDLQENELVILSKQTLDLFLGQANPADLIAVYVFYYYTAKWQGTNQALATDRYVMKGLHIGQAKLNKAQKFLFRKKIVERVNTRDKNGRITGWYIKLNYIWKNKTVKKVISKLSPFTLESTSGEQVTNALSANTINALTADICESKDSPQKEIFIADQEEITKPLSGSLPSSRGKTLIERVVSIYIDLFIDKYGIKPNLRMPAVGGAIDNLSKRYTELQISAMLITFFEWYGMNNNSSFEQDKLTAIAHPFAWFFTNINQYEIYLRNMFELDFDNEIEVRNFVAKYMVALKERSAGSSQESRLSTTAVELKN